MEASKARASSQIEQLGEALNPGNRGRPKAGSGYEAYPGDQGKSTGKGEWTTGWPPAQWHGGKEGHQAPEDHQGKHGRPGPERAPDHQQPPPEEEASWKAQEAGKEEAQAARRADHQQPSQQVAEAAAREAMRTAVQDLEGAVAAEAEAHKRRREKHDNCCKAGWPKHDTEEADKKAINEEFKVFNDIYWDAEAARMAKQSDVAKLQKALDAILATGKTGEGEGEQRQAGVPACQARSGPVENERGQEESPQQTTKKAKVPSDKKNALHKAYMVAVRKENDARHKAEDLYPRWAGEESCRAWGEETLAQATGKEERQLQLSNAIREAKEARKEGDTARGLYKQQEAAEAEADSESQSSYESGEPELHGAQEEAEQVAMEGWIPQGDPAVTHGVEEQPQRKPAEQLQAAAGSQGPRKAPVARSQSDVE